MLTLISAVFIAVLIICEKSGKLTLDSAKSSAAMMIGSAAALGLVVFDMLRSILILFNSVFEIEKYNESLSEVLGGSRAGAVVRLIITLVLIIPILAAAIYTLVKLVRKPLDRREFEQDTDFEARCASRHALMSCIAMALTSVMFAAALGLSITCWDELLATIILLNPLTVLFLLIITFGLAFIPLVMFAVLENSVLIMIFSVGSVTVGTLYIFAAALGIAAAVRAYRSRKLEKAAAIICGILSFLPVWSIVPMVWLRKKCV